MSSVGSDAGDGGHAVLRTKTPGEKASDGPSEVGSGWTRASCPCCVSGPVEPLVLLQLRSGLQQQTKDWIITLIATAVKQGGEECTKELIVNFRKTKGGTHTPIRINRTEVERVTSFKFLGVHISHQGVHEDFSWTLNTSTLSILTNCITVWYGKCSVLDRKALQRVVKTAQCITGSSLPSIEAVQHKQCLRRARSIVKYSSHPSHRLFALLPSGKRAALSAHPGEEPSGDIIVVSAPRCTLLRATEELGLCKAYHNGDMTAFSYHDRNNFQNADNVQVFLTVSERQYIVKYELEGMRAQRDLKIPGLPEGLRLQRRDNICETHMQKLQGAGVVRCMFPLNHEDKLKALSKAWYSGNQLTQPLDMIHEYFGGTVAFYFSFLDFYTWSLLPPAILGLVLTMFSGGVNKEALDSISDGKVAISSGDDDDEALTVSGHMIQAVFSMLWSTVVMEMWKRRKTTLSYRWGTMQLAERFSEPRPSYHGDMGVNPVTGRWEPLFPVWQRKLRMALVSVPMVGLFLGRALEGAILPDSSMCLNSPYPAWSCPVPFAPLGLVVLGMLGFYWGEAQVQTLHTEWDSLLSSALLYLPSVAHIVYTNALGTAYRQMALALTEFENHREESAYGDHLTGKILVFTFFNYFAVLFHIAFYKQDVPLLRKRLASLLIITQLVNQVTEVVIPFLVDRLFSAPKRSEKEEDPEEDKFRNQSNLPDFPGLFAEYIELLVQFGYLSLFSCVYPLTAVLLLLNNLTEIRSDAYKMCKLFKKPFSAPVAGMGVWQTAFEVLSFVSVISNCWLLLLSPRLQELGQENGITGTNALLVAVLMEHLLILFKMLLAILIPDEPDWIRVKREQNEFKSMQALGQQDVTAVVLGQRQHLGLVVCGYVEGQGFFTQRKLKQAFFQLNAACLAGFRPARCLGPRCIVGLEFVPEEVVPLDVRLFLLFFVFFPRCLCAVSVEAELSGGERESGDGGSGLGREMYRCVGVVVGLHLRPGGHGVRFPLATLDAHETARFRRGQLLGRTADCLITVTDRLV
ncbi:Anoctamin-10 [Merluccius polli]|uniref:Anoctamin n=1 Tax=Merluccius polli TaxID=89951 RepID=A0AA47M2S0_MERPO|nr:Anoctamin-10 [Merluccius polli]